MSVFNEILSFLMFDSYLALTLSSLITELKLFNFTMFQMLTKQIFFILETNSSVFFGGVSCPVGQRGAPAL